jgi:hypothetical protein
MTATHTRTTARIRSWEHLDLAVAAMLGALALLVGYTVVTQVH